MSYINTNLIQQYIPPGVNIPANNIPVLNQQQQQCDAKHNNNKHLNNTKFDTAQWKSLFTFVTALYITFKTKFFPRIYKTKTSVCKSFY